MTKAETILSNNRNDEKEFSKMLGLLLNEQWIIVGIELDGKNNTFNNESYHVHLRREIKTIK